MLEEKLDATQGNPNRTGGEFLDVREVEKVLPEFFITDMVCVNDFDTTRALI